MPWSRPRPCSTPGCANFQPCAVHAKPRPRDRRPNAQTRGYDAAWHKRRVHIIKRDRVCCFCGESLYDDAGHIVKKATVHHMIRKRDGGTDDDSNLSACHAACHSRHHAGGG